MNELEDLFADPAEEDLQIVRTRTLIAVRQKSESASSLWLWCALAASVIALAFFTWFIQQPTRNPTIKQDFPHMEQLVSLPMPTIPERQLRPELQHVRHIPRKKPAGLETARWIRTPDGSSQVQMQTADPNVIILLQVSSNEKEN